MSGWTEERLEPWNDVIPDEGPYPEDLVDRPSFVDEYFGGKAKLHLHIYGAGVSGTNRPLKIGALCFIGPGCMTSRTSIWPAPSAF